MEKSVCVQHLSLRTSMISGGCSKLHWETLQIFSALCNPPVQRPSYNVVQASKTCLLPLEVTQVNCALQQVSGS